MRRAAGAILVGALALLLYHATLLPGFDFGDTPSFQVMAGSPVITPRDGYPLYFAIGRLFVWTIGGDRAHALNVASAVEAAIACGLVVLVAAELSASLAAGIAAAWLFAGSYTFWSQAVIAEVYALHICFVALTLLLLMRWERHPTTSRVAWVLGVYALGFGNHLAMILLAPAYVAFAAASHGWRRILNRRTIAIAAACAVAGALQYAWNLHALYLAPEPPLSPIEALRTFWFDVTKADWRNTMVLGVAASRTGDRVRMYLFDVHQQFGWAGPILAAAGTLHLLRTRARRAWLLLAVYAVTLLFALTYNVGDTHVFLLPSHLVLALLAAPGMAGIGALMARHIRAIPASARRAASATLFVAVMVTTFATIRMYGEYPALDRSGDQRPTQFLSALTAGIDDRHAVLLTDLSWQLDNGLTYFAKYTKTDLAYARVSDVLLHAPALIRDNLAIGRQVAVTESAAAALDAAYGPLVSTVPDPRVTTPKLIDLIHAVPRGTRYALCMLRPSHPSRGFALDTLALRQSVQWLTGGRVADMPSGDYAAMTGVVGDPPALLQGADRPFHASAIVGTVPVIVRMDSWLTFDTIRRMGFGHIIAAHRHTLIVECGVSFATFGEHGEPLQVGYAAGLFAPPQRFLVNRLAAPPR